MVRKRPFVCTSELDMNRRGQNVSSLRCTQEAEILCRIVQFGQNRPGASRDKGVHHNQRNGNKHQACVSPRRHLDQQLPVWWRHKVHGDCSQSLWCEWNHCAPSFFSRVFLFFIFLETTRKKVFTSVSMKNCQVFQFVCVCVRACRSTCGCCFCVSS